MQKIWTCLGILLGATSLCAFRVGLSAPAERPQHPPLQLTARPVLERKLMSSPLAHRGLRDYFEVQCVLTNTSGQTQGFHTAAMAEWLDWKAGDSRLFVPPVPSISVGVGSVTLRPGERYAYRVPLSVHHVRAGQTVKFRVGFRLTAWKPGQRLWREGRPAPERMVWSNLVSVQVRPEWIVRSAVVAAEGGMVNQ